MDTARAPTTPLASAPFFEVEGWLNKPEGKPEPESK